MIQMKVTIYAAAALGLAVGSVGGARAETTSLDEGADHPAAHERRGQLIL
jgi:hypothetical protein